jgi:transposase-like protein
MNLQKLKLIQSELAQLSPLEKKQIVEMLTKEIQNQPKSLVETKLTPTVCPHCHSPNFKKWGKSDGLQRYKCNIIDCGRTFNSLSKTPLARLRKKSKWFKHLECMIDSLPLRRVAEKLAINLTTAFRWRHRFLKSANKTMATHVSGIVEVDETFFVESFKGKRVITSRMPKKRGVSDKYERKIPVLIVRDRAGHESDFVLENISKINIHNSLKPIIDRDSILCTDGASWYKSFAKERGIAHHRLITLDNKRVIGKEFHIQNINAYISRLKSWMVRFHGVGTDYLSNYLGWRRLFETTEVTESNWLCLAVGKQQLTQT